MRRWTAPRVIVQPMVPGCAGGDCRHQPLARRRPGAAGRAGWHLRRGAARCVHLAGAGVARGHRARLLRTAAWDACCTVRAGAIPKPQRGLVDLLLRLQDVAMSLGDRLEAVDINPVMLGLTARSRWTRWWCRAHEGTSERPSRGQQGPARPCHGRRRPAMHDLLWKTRDSKPIAGRESPATSRGWRACARHDVVACASPSPTTCAATPRRSRRAPRRSRSSKAWRCRWQAIDEPAVLRDIVGEVEEIADCGDGRFAVRIGLALATIGRDAGQLLNMLFGNTSLHDDVVLHDIALPPALIAALPRPAHRHCRPAGPRPRATVVR